MLQSTTDNISRGRNKRLIALRNQKIVIRYYYYREIQRRRTDDVFEILSSEEFFLHEITVRRIIHDNLDYFFELKKEKANEKRLLQIIEEARQKRYSQASLFN